MRTSRMRSLLASAGLLAALAACETIEEDINEAIGGEFVANLTPTTGGSGSGRAEISLNDATNVLCTDLELTPGVGMTAGHIFGPNNTTVAALDVADDSDEDDCDQVNDSVLDGIRANPGAYRVHIAATTGDLSGTLMRQP